MDSYFIMQLLSIGMSATVLVLAFDMLLKMHYSFFTIVKSLIFFDVEPLAWLLRNIRYLACLLLFVGHFLTVLGLLAQLRTHQIHAKPFEFYLSNPMNNSGLLILLYSFSHKVVKIREWSAKWRLKYYKKWVKVHR